MHIHITKTSLILIAVIVAILTFVLMVVPVSADTSISAMVDSCNCDCNTLFIQSSIPACCSISDGSFPDCVLSDVPDNEAILPSRITLSLDIHNDQHVQGVSTEVHNNPKQLLKQESSQLLPAYLCSEYHCRNSLNSEEPLLS